MKAIIIAAGRSPRLLPLTKNTPQCLLPIRSKTMIERQIQSLKDAGIEDITVVTGYLADKVEHFCSSIGVKTVFNPFYNSSGMAATLWVARGELREGFIFLYSDVLFDSEIVRVLLDRKECVCLSVKKNELRDEAEKVYGSEGVVKGISKEMKGEYAGEFVGIAKFSAEGAMKFIAELEVALRGSVNSSFIDAVNNLIKSRVSVGMYDIADARFIDVDFPEDLKKAEGFQE